MASAIWERQQKKTSLKHNVVLLIVAQYELNQLSELEEGIAEDALYIDEPYLAWKDQDDAIQLMAQSQLDDSFPQEFYKPTLFRKWYRRHKED